MAAAVGYASSTQTMPLWHNRVATRPPNSSASPSRGAISELAGMRGGRLLQQHLLEFLAKLRAVDGIGKRKFEECLEIAREIADIVALLAGGQLHCQHTAAFIAQTLDRVGELDFTFGIGGNLADHVENQRREYITAGDGEIAGRIFRLRFFDQIDDAEKIPVGLRRLDDAVVPGFRRSYLLHRDDTACTPRFEHLDHA